MNRDYMKPRRAVLLFTELGNLITRILGPLVALQYAFLYEK